MDQRIQKLAEKIVNYSCRVKENEKVLIQYSSVSDEFIEALTKEIFKLKALPFLEPQIRRNHRLILQYGTEKLFNEMAKFDSVKMSEMDAVIIIRGSENDFEYASVSASQNNLYSKLYTKPVHFEIRCNKKWVLLRYPTPSFAQSSKMSTEDFENYYFKVCNLNYKKMGEAMTPLEKLLLKTDRVHIIANETDLTFSIKNIGAVKCCGEMNVPDGEIYSAPVKNSINGTIRFNVPTLENGQLFKYIKLWFENGKVVKCESDNNEELIKILDTDNGSRYVGEFSFGLNPYVEKPIGDILFDEKMSHSIHMALGECYEDAENGNRSAIHWDLIQKHTKSLGGGEIYLDDKLIYKDGDFVLKELEGLNSQNLK